MPTLPTELVEQIALHVAVPGLSVAPPAGLQNLFPLNRAFFNCSHRLRRLEPNALTPEVLAAELVSRCRAMTRLRRAQVGPTALLPEHDLWTAYLVLLEDDGLNRQWLLEYVNIRPKVVDNLEVSFAALSDNYSQWPPETVGTALSAWILALTDTQAVEYPAGQPALSTEDHVVQLLFIFVYTHFLYHSHFGLWYLWDLPVAADTPLANAALNFMQSRISPIVPRHRQMHVDANSMPAHFGIQRMMAVPPMAHAAIACYFGRTPWATRPPMPAEGQDEARRWLNTHWQIGRTRFFGGPEGAGSEMRDNEWRRLTLCGNLYSGVIPGLGSFVRPGELEGRWDGYFRFPEIRQHQEIVAHYPGPPPQTLRPNPFMANVFNQTVQWRLKEYHCLAPNVPLSGKQEWALDAFFPPGFRQNHRFQDGSLLIYDEMRREWTKYVPHDPSINMGHVLDTIVLGHADDYWEAAMQRPAIIVYGRVRRADGLIILRRDATRSSLGYGNWLWYGYIHCGLNWIGRFTRTDHDIRTVTQGGSFIMARTAQ
ncbi:hypothetical protein BKA62DRAFT_684707 [Auriculariales sp. MPI-PUGE-AT-0066]|nr:hypothetical protein BKA62DRAFT_684707 [Auriculariales sp. MPI-PUGE-AT-0066]